MKELVGKLVVWIYSIGIPLTFVLLVIRDWRGLNWWNWIILLPIDGFLATIWPVYWVILRGLLGMR